MKNIINVLALILTSWALFSGCEEQHPTLYRNDPAVYFSDVYYQGKYVSDSITISFMDMPSESEYLVEVMVRVQGELDPDNDRHFAVRQCVGAPADRSCREAQPGVDYRALDNPEVVRELVIPAGSNFGLVPVTIFRSENVASHKVELHLELMPNDQFRLGMDNKLSYKIKFSAQPEKPATWDTFWQWVFGKSWGPVKHMFILEKLGPIRWDNTTVDSATQNYWEATMKIALEAYNLQNPLNPLSEADGTLVTF